MARTLAGNETSRQALWQTVMSGNAGLGKGIALRPHAPLGSFCLSRVNRAVPGGLRTVRTILCGQWWGVKPKAEVIADILQTIKENLATARCLV